MEGAAELLAKVEVELFGKTYEIEPTFDIMLGFEQVFGESLVNPKHWVPVPKLSAVATLLWLGIGGKASGKTKNDVAKALKRPHLIAATRLADLFALQLQEAPDEKNAEPVA